MNCSILKDFSFLKDSCQILTYKRAPEGKSGGTLRLKALGEMAITCIFLAVYPLLFALGCYDRYKNKINPIDLVVTFIAFPMILVVEIIRQLFGTLFPSLVYEGDSPSRI